MQCKPRAKGKHRRPWAGWFCSSTEGRLMETRGNVPVKGHWMCRGTEAKMGMRKRYERH